MTSSVSLPSFSAASIQTVRSVVGSAAIQAPSARTASPVASPADGGLGATTSPPGANAPRGSLLNLTV